MATLHPTVLWAQRKDKIFLTIDVQNCKDSKIGIENDDAAKSAKVTFRGTALSHATGPEEHVYALDLELYDTVDKDDVKQVTTDRTITLVIPKTEGPYWPRLLKTPGKAPLYVKADWDKWVDEDEEEEVGDDGGMGGFDPSMLQQFQNMGGGGMGGMGAMGAMGGMGGMGGMGAMGGMGGMGDMGGFDLSALGDLAAGGGMGDEGDEDDEEDDDDMPALEAPGAAK